MAPLKTYLPFSLSLSLLALNLSHTTNAARLDAPLPNPPSIHGVRVEKRGKVDVYLLESKPVDLIHERVFAPRDLPLDLDTASASANLVVDGGHADHVHDHVADDNNNDVNNNSDVPHSAPPASGGFVTTTENENENENENHHHHHHHESHEGHASEKEVDHSNHSNHSDSEHAEHAEHAEHTDNKESDKQVKKPKDHDVSSTSASTSTSSTEAVASPSSSSSISMTTPGQSWYSFAVVFVAGYLTFTR